MTGMDDALTAASLLLAAVALVYGAWSAEIEREARRTYDANAKAKAKQKDETRAVLWRKAVPLAVAGWAILAVFSPRVIAVVSDTVDVMRSGTWQYGDVPTIFVLSTVLVLGLAVHLSGRVCALLKALRK